MKTKSSNHSLILDFINLSEMNIFNFYKKVDLELPVLSVSWQMLDAAFCQNLTMSTPKTSTIMKHWGYLLVT